MKNTLALITLMIWPAIPLFWIPVHGCPRLFKRLGLFTYILPVVTWLPLAVVLYLNKGVLLKGGIDFSIAPTAAGALIFVVGGLIQIWTGRLLSLFGLMGMPEVSSKIKSRLVDEGAFAVVRHPTYLSHTLMLVGLFLFTGFPAVGIIAALDFALVYAVIIPLEERELINRFGEEYLLYMKKTPKFFPGIGHKRNV